MLADTVIELLKEEISSLEYDRYIKQLKFHEKASNSDQMVFLAPNILIANWVRTKYSDKIAHLFELKTGKKPEVKFGLGTRNWICTHCLTTHQRDENAALNLKLLATIHHKVCKDSVTENIILTTKHGLLV